MHRRKRPVCKKIGRPRYLGNKAFLCLPNLSFQHQSRLHLPVVIQFLRLLCKVYGMMAIFSLSLSKGVIQHGHSCNTAFFTARRSIWFSSKYKSAHFQQLKLSTTRLQCAAWRLARRRKIWDRSHRLTNRCRPRSRSHRRREPGCQRPRCPPGDQRRPTEALKVRHPSRPCSPARHGPQWKWGPVPRLQPHAACCHATPEELWSSHLAAACRSRMPPQPTPAGWSYVPCSQRKLLWRHRLAAIDARAKHGMWVVSTGHPV